MKESHLHEDHQAFKTKSVTMIFTFISFALYLNPLMYWNTLMYLMKNKFRFVLYVLKPLCKLHVFMISSLLCMVDIILKLRKHVVDNTLSPSLSHVSMIVLCLGCLDAKLHSYSNIKHVYLVGSYKFRSLLRVFRQEKE